MSPEVEVKPAESAFRISCAASAAPPASFKWLLYSSLALGYLDWRLQGKARFEADLHRSVLKNAAGSRYPCVEARSEFYSPSAAVPFTNLRFLLSFAKTPIFCKTMKLPSPNQNLQHTFIRGRERSGGYPVSLTPSARLRRQTEQSITSRFG
jgi:hypothetical protein